MGDFSAGNPIPFDANWGQDEGNLHIPSATTLNIQIDTFVCGSLNSRPFPVIQSRSHSRVRSNNPARFKTARALVISRIPAEKESSSSTDVQEHGVSLLLVNTMSIAPKIDEVRSVILDWSPDLAFFTETLLRDTINDNLINIPGYHFTSRNRSTDIHGGVGLYIKNSIKYKSLHHLNNPNFETLWTWPRPSRLTRGIPCVIAGIIYHPEQTVNDQPMLNHLASTLTTIEGEFHGCGLLGALR